MGPGVCRRTITPSKAGGNLYNTGTVSVTNGSKTVTGSGTTFTGNAFVDGVFQISQLAHGTDGVTNGTGAFSSSLGNFQSSMIGLTIRINTKAAYIISAVAGPTSITITDPAGVAVTPSSASGLTYDIGPESPYDIASVDSNTQLTLALPWSGPTLTGESYSTWRPIRYIADTTGQNTDGIGGIVRITGSNDDKAATRASCIMLASFNYRTFRGFSFDGTSNSTFGDSGSPSNWIIEDCYQGTSATTGQAFLICNSTGNNNTIRRCCLLNQRNEGIYWANGSTLSNVAALIENIIALASPSTTIVSLSRVGGVLIRNCTLMGANLGAVKVTFALAVGQAATINNCLIALCTTGVAATATSEIIEDYNSFSKNGTDRTNTTVGQHSNTNIPLFQPLPLLNNGRVEPWLPFSLMAASGQDDLAGLYSPSKDLFGTLRPQKTKGSWGAVQSLPLPTMNLNSGTWEAVVTGRGYLDRQMPVLNNVAVTFSVSIRWDSNATIGVKPSLELLADYGVVGQEVFAVGTGGQETITLASVTPVVPLVSGNQPNGRMILRVHNNSTDATARAAYVTALKGV